MSHTATAASRIKARVGRFWPRPMADRQSFTYIRGLATSDRRAAVGTVVDQLYPRAQHGQRQVAMVVITLLALAPSGAGFHAELGRDYLADQADVAKRTVTSALMRLRRDRLIHTPRRGRQGEGYSILALSADLLHRVADAAKAAAAERRGNGYAKSKHHNRSHGANRGTNDTPHRLGSGGGVITAASPAPDKASPEAQAAAMAAIRAKWKARTL